VRCVSVNFTHLANWRFNDLTIIVGGA